MPALDARDVRVSFGDVHALDGLSLTADEGSVTALLGPNGAGKTTFIRCCTGLARPDSGSMSILGLSPGSPDVLPMIGLMPRHPRRHRARQLSGFGPDVTALYAGGS